MLAITWRRVTLGVNNLFTVHTSHGVEPYTAGVGLAAYLEYERRAAGLTGGRQYGTVWALLCTASNGVGRCPDSTVR